MLVVVMLFISQQTAYEMRISGWSADWCSSDLCKAVRRLIVDHRTHERRGLAVRFANDQPVSDLLHLAQQCIIEAVLDDQPLGCRTALASRHESGLNNH